ncbi:MAG: hypothetical protein AABY01_01545 [Nanoarchaeota archaeon]
MKHKRRLSSSEEFDIMKLVLDKFLWIGTALMAWGLYTVFTADFASGMYRILAGAAVFIVFAGIVVREFELIR